MHWFGICVLCFLIGCAVQRWCDNAPDLEHAIYEAGYREGLRDGKSDFWKAMAHFIAKVTSNAPTDV